MATTHTASSGVQQDGYTPPAKDRRFSSSKPPTSKGTSRLGIRVWVLATSRHVLLIDSYAFPENTTRSYRQAFGGYTLLVERIRGP